MGGTRKQRERRLKPARERGSLAVLPGELIQEILWRIPAKDVVELRCVCKSWKTLISSPQFMKAIIQRTYAHIAGCASRAAKVMDSISLLLASVSDGNATVNDISDGVKASMEVVNVIISCVIVLHHRSCTITAHRLCFPPTLLSDYYVLCSGRGELVLLLCHLCLSILQSH
ncbi:uncharacterized protein LOC107637696 isoform X1 [Arachis ipaensis]|uniref:uncharacterized protein LOC107637696 isoform X1 n=1 Tax=Arachis ipaensis TaxID=130454 RepID=UPI000A2B2618|nr:uncharacterized protein LOC107637696 isoform X1 [Arachis ipaensis]XP_025629982.1 uncharacterized protein LOC112722985 isoform X1 [Arachis hypogaea]